jgi:hypothetical protein
VVALNVASTNIRMFIGAMISKFCSGGKDAAMAEWLRAIIDKSPGKDFPALSSGSKPALQH